MMKLAAFWQQMLPILPVLPVLPAHKYLSVNNLAFDPHHGMEEVIGSPKVSSAAKGIINYGEIEAEFTHPLRLELPPS